MNRLSGLTNHKHACKYHKDIVQQRVVDCSTVGLESLIQYTKVTYEKCYGSPMKLSILSGYHKKICCGCFLVFSLNPQVSFHICKNGKKKIGQMGVDDVADVPHPMSKLEIITIKSTPHLLSKLVT